MIIGLLNQKGGVGKTTLAINMSYCLSLSYRVLLIDADPQQSAMDWSEIRELSPTFDVIGYSKKTLHRDIESISQGYDHVIIDGPPKASDLMRSCIMASDFVLIPCLPGPLDVWASFETVNLVSECKIFKQDLKSGFVINKRIPNTKISKKISVALEKLETPLIDLEIGSRVIYPESMSLGRCVHEMMESPSRQSAFEEISKLTSNVMEMLACQTTN